MIIKHEGIGKAVKQEVGHPRIGSMGPIHGNTGFLDVEYIKDMQEAMRRSIEDTEFRRACAENLAMDSKRLAQIRNDEATMTERLRAVRLARIDTVSDGNCQFDAIVRTAGLSLSPEELRPLVCDHMASTGIYIPDLIDHMRGEGVYGNGLRSKRQPLFLTFRSLW